MTIFQGVTAVKRKPQREGGDGDSVDRTIEAVVSEWVTESGFKGGQLRSTDKIAIKRRIEKEFKGSWSNVWVQNGRVCIAFHPSDGGQTISVEC